MQQNLAEKGQGLSAVTPRLARLYGEWFEPEGRQGIEKAIADWAQRPMELHLFVLAHISYQNLKRLEALYQRVDELALTGLELSEQTRSEVVSGLSSLRELLEQGLDDADIDSSRLMLPATEEDENITSPAGQKPDGAGSSQLDAFLKGLRLPDSLQEQEAEPIESDPTAQTQTAYDGEDVEALLNALGDSIEASLAGDADSEDDAGDDTEDGTESDVALASSEGSILAYPAEMPPFGGVRSGGNP